MKGTLVCSIISGLSVGLEYMETEDLGFIVNLDLGILRLTWYRDIEPESYDEL